MASKGTVALQLQIDTTFKNAKEAVASLNKTLEGIKVNSSITNASGEKIVTDAKAKAKEIQEILNQIQGSNYNGVNDKIFNNLFKQLESKASELKTLQDQLKNIDLDNQSSNPSLDLVNAQDELKNFEKELEVANQLVDEAKKKQDQLSYNKTSDSYQEATEAVKSYTAEQNNLIAKVENQKTAIADLEEKQRQYNQSQNEATEVQNQINTALEQTDKVLEETNRIREQGLDSMSGQKGMLRELDKEQRENATSAENSADAQENLNNKQAEGTQSAENLASSTKEVGDAQGEAANNTNKLSATLDTAIVKWVSFRAIVQTAKRAVEDIVQTYQELDDNLSAISAVSGIATDQLWGDMPQMIDNANKLALSVDDLTNGMLLFYQQGLSTEETEIRLNAAGKMAAISQQDLSTAVDQLTSTMNAFNMTGEDAQNVVDVFANMAGKTATDVEELATAMARTASIAKNAGMTFEQTTAFIATMEETTRLSAETIGNSMKSIIARFQKLKEDPESLLEDGVNANDVEKALKKADVALRDTEGNFRNIGDVIMELSAKWDTLDTNTQKYIATMAAGTQQSSNFIALVGNYQSNVDNLAYAMDSAGASEQQFEAISSNLSSAFTRLENEWTRLKTSFADGKNIISGAVDVLSNLLHFISDIGPSATLAGGGILLLTTRIIALTVAETARQKIQKLNTVLDTKSYENYNKLAAKIVLVVASFLGLNEAQTQNLLIKTGLSAADAEELVNSVAITGANSVQAASWQLLTGAISGAVKAAWAFITSPVGLALTAITAAVGVAALAYSSYIDKQKEEATILQDQIDSLKQSAETHKEAAQNYTDESNKLQDYIERLQQAKENGEDLTDIRKEISDSFDEETLGVDATKASYENLTNALQDNIDKREELIKQETYARLKDEANEKKKEAEQLRNNQKNKKAVSAKITDSSGKEVSQEDFEKQYNTNAKKANTGSTYAANSGSSETKEAFAKRMGFTYEVEYEIQDANGNPLFTGTEEDLKKKLAELGKNFYTSSDATIAVEESGLNISDSGLNQSQYGKTLSLVSKYSNEDILDGNGNVTDKAQQAVSDLKTFYNQLIQQTGASYDQFIALVNGQETDMSNQTYDAVVQAMSVWGNFTNSTNPAVQAIAKQFQNIDETFQENIDKLKDINIELPDGFADNISYSLVNSLAEAMNTGGEDFARALAEPLTNLLSDAANEIDPSDFSSVVDAIENGLASIDWSDGSSIESYISTLKELEAQYPQLATYIDAIIQSFNDSNIAILRLQDSMNSVTSATDFLSTAVNDGYDSIAEMESAAEAAGLKLSDLGFYLDETSGKWKILSSSAQEAAEGIRQADEATANSIVSDQIKANSALSVIAGLDAQKVAQEGLSMTELTAAQASLVAAKEDADAQVKLAQSAVDAAQSILDSYNGRTTAAVEASNVQSQEVDTNKENLQAEVDAYNSAMDGIVTRYPDGAAAEGIAKGGGATVAGGAGKVLTAAELNSAKAQSMLDKAKSALSAAQEQANQINDAIGILDAYKSSVLGASNAVKGLGDSSKGGSGGSGGGAAEKSNELTDALEAQKKALQEQEKALEKSKQALEEQKKALENQKKALEETNKQLQENYKLYVELIKSRLNDEIDRQTTRIEAFYDAIKDTIQSEIDSFNNQLDALKKQADELKSKADELQDAADQQEDSLNKLYNAAQAYYDAAQDGLDNQIDAYDRVIDRNKEHVDLLNEQKDAIQDQIDALDTAADSESKLLALEKARDALANARNQKTRMVLTNGGGWRLRTDKSEISNAQSNLASAQRDYQKEILERQQKKIEEQTDEIEKQNDNLENIKSDLEDQKDALDDIKDQWDKAQDALGKTTSELEEQTNLIRQFQYGDNMSRQDQLSNFVNGVGQNNQQQQAASDATNRANEASNAYDQQSNEDVQGSIAEAIKKLEEQQNQADEALKKYFENQLSNNAETAQIQQEMKDLIDQMVNGQIGELENFAQFYETINGALEQANTNANQTADYINRMNAALDQYDEWSNRLDMTTDEINQRQEIMNQINNATLDSLLEGGSTFGQLQGQYEQIVRNNDEAEKIQGQIDGLDEQANAIQAQIDALKEQENLLSEQEKELSNANSNKVATAAKNAGTTASNGAKSAGQTVRTSVDSGNKYLMQISGYTGTLQHEALSHMSGIHQGVIRNHAAIGDAASKIANAVSNIKVTVNSSGGKSVGGLVGFSNGGVDDFTSTVAIHGTKNRPELVLNNSQSAALFKYIDSMTRIPTLSSAGSARNALMGFGATNNTNNNGTNFTNCEFNVESNADNLDSLVQDLKQSASIRR